MTPAANTSLAAYPPISMEHAARPSGNNQPLPRWKRALFTAVMLGITWALLEACASVYLRVFNGYDGKHLYEFDFDPYKNIIPARNYVDTRGVRHNAQGFRRVGLVSVAKPPHTYRIFLMGGSTAYGAGGMWPHIQNKYPVLKDSETISAYLERILADSLPGTHVEVIDAAITSAWTHQHLIYLNQTILNFSPDMVLFLDGFNDFLFTNRNHDQFADYAYTNQATSILADPTVSTLVEANGWWLYRKSPFVHIAVRALRDLKLLITTPRRDTRPPMVVDSALAGLRDVFPRSALKMHRRSGLILRDEGVHAVFMLQPMLALERGHKPFTSDEQRLFDFNIKSYINNYEIFLKRAVPFIDSEETSMASAVGGQFIDLTGIYGGVREQIYTDYCHLTPLGNRLLAATVSQHILPQVRSDIASRSAATRLPQSN